MKPLFTKIISALLGVMIVLGGVSFHAQEEQGLTAEIWDRVDVVLQSEKKYDNPYKDVQIDAVFTHESGKTISLYGFWYGGDEWRVRFSPTLTGVWEYTVTCTDEENAGLHNVKGKIIATENTGSTMIDRHGFIKVSDNGRYFVYDDGTPFFWLGDTNWQAPNYVTMNSCNYPGCKCGNQFLHELYDRLSKGFTVYQTYFDGGETDGGGQRGVTSEPSMWTKKYTKIDPGTFKNKFDVMFDMLAASGMVIALGFGVHSSTVQAMSSEDLCALSRYLTARYASYPVVWITAQEITGDPQFDRWLESARVTDAGDGYDHPATAHQYPLEVSDSFVKRLGAEEWHDFYALQNGHGPKIPSKSTYKGYYENKHSGGKKPFVESEANYEDIYCGGFNGYEASRIAAWKAVLCGSCGFTYGVTGVWANCWSTAGSTGWLGTFSTEPWYMGIEKPGSFEMKYMAQFFEYVGFERLIPRFSSSSYSDFRSDDKVVASSGDGDTYVAYFYNTDQSTGKLKGLDGSKKYSVRWYDPKTGKYIDEADAKIDGGAYVIPEKPDGGDWVLLVTSLDLGPYETEPRRSVDSSASKNLIKGAEAKCSSQSTGGSAAAKTVDGRQDTWWCASDNSFPQWLTFDMKEPVTFNAFYLQMYAGTRSVSYTVQGSNDGAKWTKIIEADNEPASAGDCTVGGRLKDEQTYRYLRVDFDSVTGNWAAVVEAFVYKYEGVDRQKFQGQEQTPGVKCIGSSRYTEAGMLKETASKLFDGDLSKEWKPFAAESTQTIILDMYEKKTVYGLEMIMGADSVLPEYRIEGSDDGKDWFILADATVRPINSTHEDGRNVLFEELSGQYRYIKVIIMGAQSGDSVKTIAEMKLYAEGPTAAAPDETDLSALTSLYRTCARIKNKKGEYDGGKYRNVLNALINAHGAISGGGDQATDDAAYKTLQTAYDVLMGIEPETEDATDTDPADTDPPSTDGGEKPGTSGRKIAVIAAAAAAAVAVAVITASVIRKKRKK